MGIAVVIGYAVLFSGWSLYSFYQDKDIKAYK